MSQDPNPLIDELDALLLGEAPSLTKHEVAALAEVPIELAEELWHHLGFAHLADTDVAFSQRDVEALKNSVELVGLGILSPDSQAALVRTWGRSYARLADWQVSLLAGLALEEADPAAKITELASEVLPRIESLQAYVWRRHLASAAGRLLTDFESVSDNMAVMSVCFIDIVGYTSQSKALTERELVEWIEGFERETTGLVVDHGGSVIKTIGDEVLFTVDDPVAAIAIAVELTARGDDGEDPYPQVRAGLAHGEVVRRLGDVFGPVVNIASRLTRVARPGTVVVDRGVFEALEGESSDEDGRDGVEGAAVSSDEVSDGHQGEPKNEETEHKIRLRRLRRVSVKGYSRLDAWAVRPNV